jgi:hypothetical protein
MSDDLYRFEFEGGPIDDPANAPEVFQAIGHFAASWSRLETHIDVLLVQINKRQFSAALHNTDHPISFTGKIKLLKKWFNQHPVLKPYADNVRELTSRLKSLSNERNTYLHSIIESYNPVTQTVVFRYLISIKNDNFKLGTATVPLDRIHGETRMISLSNKFLWTISREIFTDNAIARLGKS